MLKTFLLTLLLSYIGFIHAQVKPPLAVEEIREGLNPADEIRLFDLQEIKKRKIDQEVISMFGPKSPCGC